MCKERETVFAILNLYFSYCFSEENYEDVKRLKGQTE